MRAFAAYPFDCFTTFDCASIRHRSGGTVLAHAGTVSVRSTAVGTFFFLLALAMAIAFAWWRGRKSPLHRALRARPVLDADAIRAELGPQFTLDPQTTRDVLRATGEALGIDPGRLRLTDPFEALWDMNPQAGFHQRATFETWVLRRYPALPAMTNAATLADLVEALQRQPLLRR